MSSLIQAIAETLRANRKLVPAFVLIALLAGLLALRAGRNYHASVLEDISSKAERYSAFQSMLDRADDLRRLKEVDEERARKLEGGLLDADKPSIGAAKLQEAFKSLAAKKRISVTSERALPVVYADRYARVPVEFKLKAGLTELTDLLYEIQTSPVLMGVRSVSVKALESGGPAVLDVTIVVEGAIRKQAGV